MYTDVLYRLFRATFSGAVGALVAKFFINSMVVMNGVGWIDRMLGSPPWWMWILAGGAVGGVGQALVIWRQRERTDVLASWAEQNGYEYLGVVSQSELGDAGDMRVFDSWYQGNNLLAARKDEVLVEMFDVKVRGSGRTRAKHPEQTVTLIRNGVEGLPDFEVRSIRLGRFPDMGWMTVRFDVGEAVERKDSITIKRFQQLYAVSLATNQRRTRNSDQDEYHGLSDLEKLRNVISTDLMQLLIASPGWNMDLLGGNLACWKANRVVPVSQRSSTIEEVWQLRNTLIRSGKSKPPKDLRLTLVRSSEHPAKRAFVGAVVGGFFGTATAMFAGLFWFVFVPFSPRTIPVLFGGILLGSATGTTIGFLVGRETANNQSS